MECALYSGANCILENTFLILNIKVQEYRESGNNICSDDEQIWQFCLTGRWSDWWTDGVQTTQLTTSWPWPNFTQPKHAMPDWHLDIPDSYPNTRNPSS